MRKKYPLCAFVLFSILFASCKSKPGKETNADYQNKNYMEGRQSDINRNVEQLEKRREADERKIDVSDYNINKPK